VLQEDIIPSISSLFLKKGLHFKQDAAPPHYHTDVRSLLDVRFPGRWIGRRGSVEYPPRSPALIPLDYFLWGALYNAVYTSKPRTLQDLRCETETACDAVPLATIQNVCQSVALCCQQCLAAGGGHFEHL
jgi:hypothetical protein